MLLPFASKSQRAYELADTEDREHIHYELKRSNSPMPIRRHLRRRNFTFILLTVTFLWYSFHKITAYLAPAVDKNGFLLPVEIPNKVHFVRQMNRDAAGRPKPLRFEFRHLLAYWSAHHYLSPKEINIWSDADDESIAEAKENGDYYTKALFRLPKLKFHHVTMPNMTTYGTPITAYAHKSDFIRTRVMAEHGGQYLDDDSWVIRDLAPFRKAGFENVFGRQWLGDVCNAFWMSTPNNTLMRAWEILQEREFDGEWGTASLLLGSQLVQDVRGLTHDRHALILEQDAFFPGMWHSGDDGLPQFYKVQGDIEPGTTSPNGPVANLTQLVDKYVSKRKFGWRREWRTTYVIHGYSNALRGLGNHDYWGEFGEFSPQYVLSRRSNVALALAPAVEAAFDTGFLDMKNIPPIPPYHPPPPPPPPPRPPAIPAPSPAKIKAEAAPLLPPHVNEPLH